MNSRLIIAGVLIAFSTLAGCTDYHAQSTEKLVSFVKNRDFGVPVVFMEKQGSFYAENWFKVTMYFGYSDDNNWNTCIEDAKRWTARLRAGVYRCVLAE
jgi:hypothetical protein